MNTSPWSRFTPAVCTLHLFYAALGDEAAGLPSVLGSAGASVATVCGLHLESFGDGVHVLPRVLVHRTSVAVRADGRSLAAEVADADLSLVALPFGGLVACLRLAVSDPRAHLHDLLATARDGATGSGLKVNGKAPLTAAVDAPRDEWLGNDHGLRDQILGLGASALANFHLVSFEQDVLRLVHDNRGDASSTDFADDDAVADLIYYGALPYGYGALRERAGVLMPVLSNRYRGTLAAVGPNGAVSVAHARQLTNAMVVTTAMALAAMEQARFIWHAVYAARELLPEAGKPENDKAKQRQSAAPSELAELLARLRTWETELSYGAMAYVDIRPLVRSSVVGEFHHALAESIALPAAVRTSQTLLDRLNRAAEGRQRELDLLRRKVDDRRNQRVAIVATLFAMLAIVPAIIFGYYGSNVGLRRNDPGFFDEAFLPFLTWVAIGMTGAITALLLVIRAGRRDRSTAETLTPPP